MKRDELIKNESNKTRIQKMADFKDDLDELFHQYFPDIITSFGINTNLFGEKVSFGKYTDNDKIFLVFNNKKIENEDLGLLIEQYIEEKSK